MSRSDMSADAAVDHAAVFALLDPEWLADRLPADDLPPMPSHDFAAVDKDGEDVFDRESWALGHDGVHARCSLAMWATGSWGRHSLRH
jgi:hypothetical protein